MKITFVGGGNMASALIGGLVQQGVEAAALAVVEIGEEARARLVSTFGVRTVAAADATVLDGVDVVLLAVKPQQMREVARGLAPRLREQLVLSIAAGIRVADLSRWLGGHRRIVRVMPNTPALIRRGVSGLYAPPGVNAEERARAERILGAVGATLWCEREEMLDAVTAVSGSGPAYVFYFLEALERAAAGLGFDAAAAKTLVHGTFAGAIGLAQASEEPPATLRARVTSKGGTTAAAIRTMEAAGVADAIVAAVRAADARARELGDEFGRDP